MGGGFSIRIIKNVVAIATVPLILVKKKKSTDLLTDIHCKKQGSLYTTLERRINNFLDEFTQRNCGICSM